MLIPSIDLMGGKIVQLVQGEKKALEFENFGEWVERFSRLSPGAIDGSGRRQGCRARIDGWLLNSAASWLARWAEAFAPPLTSQAVLDCGARKVIIGSSLITISRQAHEFGGPARGLG